MVTDQTLDLIVEATDHLRSLNKDNCLYSEVSFVAHYNVDTGEITIGPMYGTPRPSNVH